MNTELTLKEALEQGYRHYVYNKDGYQGLKDLDDPTCIDWEREDIYLVEKDARHPFGMSSKDIAELLAEHLHENHHGETGCDTEDVYDAIIDLDFSDVEARLNNALSKINYYQATGIKLIKDI